MESEALDTRGLMRVALDEYVILLHRQVGEILATARLVGRSHVAVFRGSKAGAAVLLPKLTRLLHGHLHWPRRNCAQGVVQSPDLFRVCAERNRLDAGIRGDGVPRANRRLAASPPRLRRGVHLRLLSPKRRGVHTEGGRGVR